MKATTAGAKAILQSIPVGSWEQEPKSVMFSFANDPKKSFQQLKQSGEIFDNSELSKTKPKQFVKSVELDKMGMKWNLWSS